MKLTDPKKIPEPTFSQKEVEAFNRVNREVLLSIVDGFREDEDPKDLFERLVKLEKLIK